MKELALEQIQSRMRNSTTFGPYYKKRITFQDGFVKMKLMRSLLYLILVFTHISQKTWLGELSIEMLAVQGRPVISVANEVKRPVLGSPKISVFCLNSSPGSKQCQVTEHYRKVSRRARELTEILTVIVHGKLTFLWALFSLFLLLVNLRDLPSGSIFCSCSFSFWY